MCSYVDIWMQQRICIFTLMYMNVCKSIYIYVYTFDCLPCTCVFSLLYVDICTYEHTCEFTRVNVRVCLYICVSSLVNLSCHLCKCVNLNVYFFFPFENLSSLQTGYLLYICGHIFKEKTYLYIYIYMCFLFGTCMYVFPPSNMCPFLFTNVVYTLSHL